MKIAFDVMGSDHGSLPAIAAALEVIKEFKNVEICLVGDEKQINGNLQILLKNKALSSRITILATTQVITMNDGPLAGIRMTDSSMNQAIQLVKNKKADGILTSGSTAAYLGACHFLLGEIKGIKRPAFMPIMPTLIKDRQVVLLPIGYEGQLTSLRSKAVRQETLAAVAIALGLQDYLFLGNGEKNTGGQQRESILSDVFESFLAAVYLDLGNNNKILMGKGVGTNKKKAEQEAAKSALAKLSKSNLLISDHKKG
ncbi:uncharacterized protein LOC113369632 [Ctenocephalides felis]|uniref:uncharacterized protein LOC113369632 n=1 Tax=Ctenocephalides felis TaxID=7515 RepID=UPI000E6E4D71|nr:uncharacterized protein LOC113369632 [Ctenocephalides felis]